MKHWVIILATSVSVLAGSIAQASKHDQAIYECKQVIRDAYGVSNFRNTFADRVGRDRFRVYGKIKHRGGRYPFSCKVKRGWVQSYHYDGPHGGYDNNYYRNGNRAQNIALGVGLAALAAAAIAASSTNQANDGNADLSQPHAGNENSSFGNNITKYDLEDKCGRELGDRIRREHDGVHRIAFSHSQVERNGLKLTGNGHVQWQHYEPSILEFSCSFDNSGRVTDSSYSYY